MKDMDRAIGVLEEQGRWQAKKLEGIDERFDRIETKIDSLIEFKWKAAGMILCLAFVGRLVVDIALAK